MLRRKFLKLTALGVATLGLVASPFALRLYRRYRYRKLSDAEVAASIRGHFPYLKIDEQGVLKYAREYRERFGDVYAPPREGVYMTFLLSTDFFHHDADESRLLAYKGIYDPYDGCANPFAEFD